MSTRTKLDLETVEARLAEITAADEAIADRKPLAFLPRPPTDVPNVPALRARIREIQRGLQVARLQPGVATGHDLDSNGNPVLGRDLSAIGTIEQVRRIPRGDDRALPQSTVIVRVRFPDGAHIWFDPAALVLVDVAAESAREKAGDKAGKDAPA